MKNAYAELKTFRQSWDALRAARPTEAEFSQFMNADANAADFDALFDDWDKSLGATAANTKPLNAPVEKVVEVVLLRLFRELKALTDGAAQSGFNWLLQQTAFFQKVVDAQVAMVPVVEKRFRLRKELVQYAQSQLVQEVTLLERGATLASNLAGTQREIQDQSQSVVDSVSAAEKAKEQVAKDAAEAHEKLEKINTAAEQVTNAKGDFDDDVKEASSLLSQANVLLGEVTAARDTADTSLGAGTKLLDQSQAKLKKALADINRQALAESFAQRAEELKRERSLWIVGFLASIAWLVYVAFMTAAHAAVTPDAITHAGVASASAVAAQPIWEVLLHALPFVIPGVWLGWLSAKNAGLTGRVQQDYNYKVATALAFQGYRNEVASLEDKDLQKRLIEIAITNFGENPIRIYEGKDEHGHPLEALKSIFQDDNLFAKFLDFMKASKPSIG